MLAVPTGNRSGSHCTEGWLGPRACLDCCGRPHPHRIVQPVASRLFQRRYPSPQVDNQGVFKRVEFRWRIYSVFTSWRETSIVRVLCLMWWEGVMQFLYTFLFLRLDENSLAELWGRNTCGCGECGTNPVLSPARLPWILLSIQQYKKLREPHGGYLFWETNK